MYGYIVQTTVMIIIVVVIYEVICLWLRTSDIKEMAMESVFDSFASFFFILDTTFLAYHTVNQVVGLTIDIGFVCSVVDMTRDSAVVADSGAVSAVLRVPTFFGSPICY